MLYVELYLVPAAKVDPPINKVSHSVVADASLIAVLLVESLIFNLSHVLVIVKLYQWYIATQWSSIWLTAWSTSYNIDWLTLAVDLEYSTSLNVFRLPSPTPSHMEHVLWAFWMRLYRWGRERGGRERERERQRETAGDRERAARDVILVRPVEGYFTSWRRR